MGANQNQCGRLQARMGQFTGATSISSSQYYNDGAEDDDDQGEFMNRLTLQAQQDMQQVRNMAAVAGSKLGTLAGNLLRDLSKF